MTTFADAFGARERRRRVLARIGAWGGLVCAFYRDRRRSSVEVYAVHRGLGSGPRETFLAIGVVPFAYVSRHVGSGLLTYLAHYLIARGIWTAIERLFGYSVVWPIVIGVVLLAVVVLTRRRRYGRQSGAARRYRRW